MSARNDPYLRMWFLLEIGGISIAGFSECHMPAATSSVVKYREGTDPSTPRKLPGLNEYGPLVLEVGVTDASQELFEWRQLVERGKMASARRKIAVVLLDAERQPAARWEFDEAWPAQYEAPRLEADSSDVAIERLVVVHEGFERVVDDTESDGGRTSDEVPTKPSKPPSGELPRDIEKPQGLDESRRKAILRRTDDENSEDA